MIKQTKHYNSALTAVFVNIVNFALKYVFIPSAALHSESNILKQNLLEQNEVILESNTRLAKSFSWKQKTVFKANNNRKIAKIT